MRQLNKTGLKRGKYVSKPLRIAVGSKNPVKLAATRTVLQQAFPDANFISVAVPSGVSDQPWGEDETRQGALNRARRALETVDADLGVGLEGGLEQSSVGLMTTAWCAITATDGRVGFGGGLHMLLPPIIANLLTEVGELGPAMDTLINETDTKHRMGAIGILTNGLSSRQAAYQQLVALAAAPFVTGYYPTQD